MKSKTLALEESDCSQREVMSVACESNEYVVSSEVYCRVGRTSDEKNGEGRNRE